MKNIIFCLLIIVSASSFGVGIRVVNIWNLSSNPTEGGQMTVFLKCDYENTNDTGRIYIKDLSTTKFVQIGKFNIYDLVQTTPTGPDETYEIIVTIPSGYAGECEVFSNYTSIPRSQITVSPLTSVISYQEASVLYDMTYYNINGMEIKKPTEGFFIWKTNNGLSGKSYIID